MHNYKQLEVWRKGIHLATAIYELTKEFPKEEKFGIVSQMRRCSVSISSNISFGSCAELETQLIISHKLQYLAKEEFEEILSDLAEIQKMIYTLIQKFS